MAAPRLRHLVACLALYVAALVWNAVVDDDESGDPADTLGHELVAVGPAVLALAAMLALATVRLRRGTVAPDGLVALGAAGQILALVRLVVGDVTGPHSGEYAFSLLVGAAAMLIGLGWVALRARRHGNAATAPIRHAAGIVTLLLFGVWTLVALVAWFTDAAAFGWIAFVLGGATVVAWFGLAIACLAVGGAERDDVVRT